MRNPWMSMYLSAANRVAGSVRTKALAEARRQQAAARKEAEKQIADFWTGGPLTSAAPKKPRSRR